MTNYLLIGEMNERCIEVRPVRKQDLSFLGYVIIGGNFLVVSFGSCRNSDLSACRTFHFRHVLNPVFINNIKKKTGRFLT